MNTAREIFERQNRRLSRLLSDLDEIGRITDPAVQLHKKPLDFRSVVRAAIAAAKQSSEWGRQIIDVRLPEQELPIVGDENRLGQAMETLLRSARQHTPQGAIILFEAKAEGDEIVVVVRNAASMAPELGARQPFRADLRLVQRLLMLHGGSLEAGTSDQGSHFILRLPARRNEDQGLPAARNAGVSPPVPRRVVIVDDNLDAANVLRLLLEGDGHEVRVATDGHSGLALVRGYRPDYLLLDIGLPRLSGYDIAASVRADPALKAAKIVAVTGYGQVHDRSRTAAAGFDHHLTKPVDFTALQRLLGAG